MARYRIDRAWRLGANKHAAGSEVTVPDETVPSVGWTPLDAAAEAAWNARQASNPYKIGKSGQPVDTRNGVTRIATIPLGGAWPHDTEWST